MPDTTPRGIEYPLSGEGPRVAQLKKIADTTDDAITNALAGLTARKTWTPAWSQSDGATLAIGNGTIGGWYSELGPLVIAGLFMKRGSTTNVGSSPNAYIWSLPTNSALWERLHGGGAAKGQPVGVVPVGVGFFGLSGTGGRIGAAWPGSWAVGDIISASLVYWKS